MKSRPIIGYRVGIGGNDPHSSEGPLTLQHANILPKENFNWHTIAHSHTLKASASYKQKLTYINELSLQLALLTRDFATKNQQIIVIGGDHTSAIGTWSGVGSALAGKPLGLLWIDAHMDSHTPETSHSKNIHGMPLAALLGYSDPKLTQIISPHAKVLPQHICLVGVRSYEAEEYELLKQLKVKIFFMDDIKQLGLKQVMQQALHIVTTDTAGFGISLDLDAIDPLEAPGVSCRESDGIAALELCAALQIVQQMPNLLGIEIAEFNPSLDVDVKTQKVIQKLLIAMLNP